MNKKFLEIIQQIELRTSDDLPISYYECKMMKDLYHECEYLESQLTKCKKALHHYVEEKLIDIADYNHWDCTEEEFEARVNKRVEEVIKDADNLELGD